ncbi:hypothetical protein [Streptomyces kurssanovii]|uniref:Uncharacterized protein n=1 Tax=Streptomyces kurssanovii TaxID=67312 RepID=A0ABV3HRW8_9ACTN
MGELTGLIRGRLTVGMVAGCAVTPFFDGLAVFHRAHRGWNCVCWRTTPTG